MRFKKKILHRTYLEEEKMKKEKEEQEEEEEMVWEEDEEQNQQENKRYGHTEWARWLKQASRLATGWTARVRSRVSEGWRFTSVLNTQTAPGVHSATIK